MFFQMLTGRPLRRISTISSRTCTCLSFASSPSKRVVRPAVSTVLEAGNTTLKLENCALQFGSPQILRISQQQLQLHPKYFSSSTPPSTTPTSSNQTRRDKLRVAVVGGGCAGLSTALHLAPLVEEGYIAAPIDIYDSGDGAGGRDIGVGLWTTALDPFGYSPRDSHQALYKELTQTKLSTWLDYVGYRTPNGDWLMVSRLPPDWKDHMGRDFPGLLFMRERDLLGTLQKAVLLEQQLGTLKLHRSASSSVVGVAHDEWWDRGQIQHPWSGKLEFQTSSGEEGSTQQSERDYHLIVAADGTFSNLRQKYGGRDDGISSGPSSTLSGANISGGPSVDLPAAVSKSNAGHWTESSLEQAVGLQDRNYTVFRGNAPITMKELNTMDPDGEYDDRHRISFQTWGTGKSMRFATVPMLCPPSQQSTASTAADTAASKSSKKYQEHQVWFITVNDSKIDNEPDPRKRVDMLLEHFKDWHSPIKDIVRSTDPNSILMERAIAHRHCMGPVVNLNRILQEQYQKDVAKTDNHDAVDKQRSKSIGSSRLDFPYTGGPGPAIVFIGDAFMTIDPILAQGFTVAMEGSANLYETLHKALSSEKTASVPPLAFNPYVLRDQLQIRHEERMDRLICLLRATELVQALGQPQGESVFGFFNTRVLRPLMMEFPAPTKRRMFDKVLKYSLGLPIL